MDKDAEISNIADYTVNACWNADHQKRVCGNTDQQKMYLKSNIIWLWYFLFCVNKYKLLSLSLRIQLRRMIFSNNNRMDVFETSWNKWKYFQYFLVWLAHIMVDQLIEDISAAYLFVSGIVTI